MATMMETVPKHEYDKKIDQIIILKAEVEKVR